jgi:hypothetical protein
LVAGREAGGAQACAETAVNNSKIRLSADMRDMLNLAVSGERRGSSMECDFSHMAMRQDRSNFIAG